MAFQTEFGHLHAFPMYVTNITLITILALKFINVSAEQVSQIALPNCPEKCGNVTIPYPFGIGENCHYNHTQDGIYYKIDCDKTQNPVIPTYGEVEVLNISLDGQFRVSNYISYICYRNGLKAGHFTSWIQVTRFALSNSENIAGAIGCDTMTFFSGTRMKSTSQFMSGCVTGCSNISDVSQNCTGIGCCLASLPCGVTNITLNVGSIDNQTYVEEFNPCSVSFLVAKDHMAQNGLPFSIKSMLAEDADYLRNVRLPIVYDWSIGKKDCKTAQDTGEYICKGNSTCVDTPADEWGYRCQCMPGFQGNPYLHGCQDIDECEDSSKNRCEKKEYCFNLAGNYTCKCLEGFYGNATFSSPCVRIDTSQHKLLLAIKIIVGVGGGIIISLMIGFLFHWRHGNKKLQKLRKTCFAQNGGNILLQKLSNRDISVGNMVRFFKVEELMKATENYSEKSVIGRGGFGMVYKGIMPDCQVVAIKKSLKVDSSQVEQFTNEVIALSQINNKNVVKLLGCCLETEVPLLVYEFISNGTLHDHLHNEEKFSFLSWDVRLSIATDVANVLAYLHTTISTPIIHRDIKSANILLDDKYTAKVADFGASKLAPVDKDQLATMVQGTCGYLDPEYMQTGELTEKSDVYSFGVVLVELLTQEKAICYSKPESERSLAVYFLRKVKEGRLLEILDSKIVSDGAIDQLKEVANLAKACLKLKGEHRPTMKEVARELEKIKGLQYHPWSNEEKLLEEENELLLEETRVINDEYNDHSMNEALSSQSRVVQLVPLNDGR